MRTLFAFEYFISQLRVLLPPNHWFQTIIGLFNKVQAVRN